jgi:excisionase family DNA binding protein
MEMVMLAPMENHMEAVPLTQRVFLTPYEAAQFSGLPQSYLRRLVTSGQLKALKTGSGWRIPRVALEALAVHVSVSDQEISLESGNSRPLFDI